ISFSALRRRISRRRRFPGGRSLAGSGPTLRPLTLSRTFKRLINPLDTHEPLAFTETNETHALGIATNDRDFINRRPHQRARRTDEHHFLSLGDLKCRNSRAIAIRGLQSDDTLPTTPVRRKIIERRQLAVTGFRRR